MAEIRVLIADDHPVVREGLRALVSMQKDMVVVGEASDGLDATSKVAELRPDVVLLDLMMPRMDGVTAIPHILRACPEIRILVLTSYADDEKIVSAIRAGALGYLLKEASPRDLLSAIREVHRGESPLPPSIARKLITEFTRPQQRAATPDAEPLSEREIEVLSLMASGLSNREIADRLVISERTVHTHVSHILHKLDLPSRTQAALYAVRQGMVQVNVA